MNKLLTIFGSTLIVLGLFALAGIPGMEISAQVTEYPALQTTTILVIAFLKLNLETHKLFPLPFLHHQ